MRMREKRKRFLLLSLAISLLTFTPVMYNFGDNHFPIFVSVAHAEIKTYVGIDTAMCDFGENDPAMVKMIQAAAQSRAIQRTKEQAGVYIKSYTKTINAMVSEDSISTITNNIVDVSDVKFKKIPYAAHKVSGEAFGKIGFMYEAIVTVKVDTNGIFNYLKRSQKERAAWDSQNKGLQESIDKTNKELENIQQNSIHANTESEQNKVKSDLNKAYNDLLANQKLDEGNRLSHKKDYQGSIFKYNEAIKLNPNYAEAYNNRGYVYYELKNYREAIADFNKAIQINPNIATAYNNRALIYEDIEDYKQAIADYDKAIQNDPNSDIAYNNRGGAYHNLKNYNQALADFNKAIQLNPNYADSYYNRGLSYKDLENYKQALADFTKAIQLDPNYLEAYNIRGLIYTYLKNFNQAITDFEKSIQINPNYIDAYYNRGLVYGILKNYKQSIEDFNKVIQLTPDNSAAYYYRGLAHQTLGNYAKAEKDFAKARELGYNN